LATTDSAPHRIPATHLRRIALEPKGRTEKRCGARCAVVSKPGSHRCRTGGEREGEKRGIQGNRSRNGNGYARNCETRPECDKSNTPLPTPSADSTKKSPAGCFQANPNTTGHRTDPPGIPRSAGVSEQRRNRRPKVSRNTGDLRSGGVARSETGHSGVSRNTGDLRSGGGGSVGDRPQRRRGDRPQRRRGDRPQRRRGDRPQRRRGDRPQRRG
jgi:hypothetical protein